MTATTTVLHVDDDPEFLTLSASVFGDDGRFEVIPAESASEGLERLSETRVDCVVSDSVRLPDGDAFVNVVGREYPDVPVILFTAKDLAAVADELQGVSVTEYVRKAGPKDFETVLTHLSRITTDAPSSDGPVEFAVTDDAQTADDAGESSRHSPVPDLGGEWTVVGLHDWDEPEEITVSVVAALASLTDTEMEALPPLYHEIDPEALAGVVCPHTDGSYRHGVQVRFPYVGYECAVTGGGAVAVRELSDDEA